MTMTITNDQSAFAPQDRLTAADRDAKAEFDFGLIFKLVEDLEHNNRVFKFMNTDKTDGLTQQEISDYLVEQYGFDREVADSIGEKGAGSLWSGHLTRKLGIDKLDEDNLVDLETEELFNLMDDGDDKLTKDEIETYLVEEFGIDQKIASVLAEEGQDVKSGKKLAEALNIERLNSYSFKAKEKDELIDVLIESVFKDNKITEDEIKTSIKTYLELEYGLDPESASASAKYIASEVATSDLTRDNFIDTIEHLYHRGPNPEAPSPIVGIGYINKI